ncbi:TonB-dependent receptor plug domain-containing protein [Vibrio algarum]|uniref:TonB-dependent receptor n=1 Tax=Vibrio algarum TaxID=3020714 RepID=A0ABT4YXB9_9VIBR|nr:TonB-dependent receptor [Vibrio sp. KJ40-1]MDB1126247.1 TonB-dependent receptor [Vibrio sp. KJ40-1]
MRIFCLASFAMTCSVFANEDTSSLPSLDLESLMAADVQANAAMKRLQSTAETAASIYVLSNDEIIKSGVNSIPQALTLVPGLQVRKIDNNVWAITARAPAGRYSSKLLVMIDGQSIHNPSFAGVDWEGINVPLFDIDRIEVIRGQSGLLWGSNATNGVINIITKHSEDTRTTKLEVSAGSQLNHQVTGRFGSDLGEYGAYRVYASNRDSDQSSNSYKGLPSDSGETTSLGMRSDLIFNNDLSLILQADYTQVDNGQTVSLSDLTTFETYKLESASTRDDLKVMTRLEHRLGDYSTQMLQASYLRLSADTAYHNEEFAVLDVDYQMNTIFNDVKVDWGLNYRNTQINSDDTGYVMMTEDIDSITQYGAFAQVQFDLIPSELNFSLGNRSEHNDFTGWEHQPIARLMWKPAQKHVFWSSLSQGIRIPSLIELNGQTVLSGKRVGDEITTGNSYIDDLYLPLYLNGNSDIEAEKTISVEFGYRYLRRKWNLDFTVFKSQSKNALALETDVSPLSIEEIAALNNPLAIAATLQSTRIDYTFVSNAELESYGSELVLAWQPNQDFKAEIGYNFTSYEYQLEDATRTVVGQTSDLSQLFLKSSVSLNDDHFLFALYRLEDGEAYNTDDFGVLDLSWSWIIHPSVAFTLTGNNLLENDHIEYKNTDEVYTVPTYIESSIVARVTANF